jgi:hypothetical protein
MSIYPTRDRAAPCLGAGRAGATALLIGKKKRLMFR